MDRRRAVRCVPGTRTRIPLDVGDAHTCVRLVPPVHRDEVGSPGFDLTRIAKSTAINATDAGNPSRERLDDVGCLAIVTEHDNIGIDRVDRFVEQQDSGDVMEGSDDTRVRQHRGSLLRG